MQSLLNELSLMFKWLVLIYVLFCVLSAEWHSGDILLRVPFSEIPSRNRIAWRKSRITFGFWGDENAKCTFEVSCVIARSNFPHPRGARFDPIPGHGLPLRGFAITFIGHTTLGGTPLDEWSARHTDESNFTTEQLVNSQLFCLRTWQGGVRDIS